MKEEVREKYEVLKKKYGPGFSEDQRDEEDYGLIKDEEGALENGFIHLLVEDKDLTEEDVKNILKKYLKGAALSSIMLVNSNEDDALQLAIRSKNYDVANFILLQLSPERFEENKLKIDINRKDEAGRNALWYALDAIKNDGKKAEDLCKHLLRKGANLEGTLDEKTKDRLAKLEVQVKEEALKQAEKELKITTELNSLKSSFKGFSDVLHLVENIDGGKKVTSDPLRTILLKLPTFEKLLESDDGKKIARRFAQYHLTLPETGIAAVDEAKRNEEYLRFIARDCAVLTAASKPFDGKQVSIDELVKVLQETLGDTGTNITTRIGIIGKRPKTKKLGEDFNQFGAGSGGLGDKVSKAAFLAFEKAIDGEKDDAEKKRLTEDFLRNDNVELIDGKLVFLDRNVPEEKKKIEAYTVTRETTEELLELAIASYLEQGQTKPLKEIIREILGNEELSVKAKKIVDAQEKSVQEIIKTTFDKHSLDNQGAGLTSVKDLLQNKVYRDLYRKLYKEKVEPHFALLLKQTVEGKALLEEVLESINSDEVVGCVVNDLTYPKKTLNSAVQNIAEGEEDQYSKILAPQSTSYFVIPKEGSAIDRIVKGATGLADKKMKDLQPYVVECKGFENNDKDPLKHFVRLLELYSEYDSKEGGFYYPHEGFVQIQATLKFLREQEVTDDKIAQAVEAKFTDYKKFFAGVTENKDLKIKGQKGIARQLNELVAFGIEDLTKPGVKLETPDKVAEVLFGEDLAEKFQTKFREEKKSGEVASKAEKAFKIDLRKSSHDFAENIKSAINNCAANLDQYPRIKKSYFSFAKAPYLTFEGCENFGQYIDYLQKIAGENSALKNQLKKVFGCDDNNLKNVISALPAFQNGAMSDPKFFHYFLISLNKLEAEAQSKRDGEIEPELKDHFDRTLEAMKSPQKNSSYSAFLGSEISGSSENLAVNYAGSQGRRLESQDSFLAGTTNVNGDKVFPALDKMFKDVQKSLAKKYPEGGGATATVCHVEGDQIRIANCGDSRAVLYVWDENTKTVTATRLTADHRLDHSLEMARIESLGGNIQDKNMPRALGDVDNNFISNTPDFYRYNLKELGVEGKQAHICVSCDGLFANKFSEQQYAAALTKWFNDPQLQKEWKGNMSEFMADCATTAAKSKDNVSVVTCDLTQANNTSRMLAMFDGHDSEGHKVSSDVAQQFSQLTNEKDRVMHCASDFKSLGYKAKTDLAPQILKKSKAEAASQDILGVKEKATPREIVNSCKKMLELIEQQPGSKKSKEAAVKVVSQAFLKQFLESCKTNSSEAISYNEYFVEGKTEEAPWFEKVKSNVAAGDFEKAQKIILAAIAVSNDRSHAKEDEMKIIAKETSPTARVATIVSYVQTVGNPAKFIPGTTPTPLVFYVAVKGSPEQLNKFLQATRTRSEEIKTYYNVDEVVTVNGVELNALHSSIGEASIEKILLLLRNGANPNLILFGKTPLEGTTDKKIAKVLLQYGAKISENLSSEVLLEMNEYDRFDLSAYGAITPSLADQIIARKKDRPARILGLCDGGKEIPATIPLRVVEAFNKLLGELGEEKSPAKSIIAKAFLEQFSKSRGELFSEVSSASSLVAGYANILSIIKVAEENLSSESYTDAEKTTVLGQAHSNNAIAFKEKLNAVSIITTAEFNKVLEEVKKFGENPNAAIYQIFTRIVPGENCKIDAKDFSDLMSKIPQTSDCKEARQSLSRAFYYKEYQEIKYSQDALINHPEMVEASAILGLNVDDIPKDCYQDSVIKGEEDVTAAIKKVSKNILEQYSKKIAEAAAKAQVSSTTPRNEASEEEKLAGAFLTLLVGVGVDLSQKGDKPKFKTQETLANGDVHRLKPEEFLDEKEVGEIRKAQSLFKKDEIKVISAISLLSPKIMIEEGRV